MTQHYSVLMSVYHKEKPLFLREAMESILHQTIPTNDFVLVCDGPLTSDLDNVIDEMKTSFGEILRVHKLKENQGLGNALNIGLSLCRNDLVARMDSDDICLLNRCELQLQEFEKDESLSLLSGVVEQFHVNTMHIIGKRKVPSQYRDIITFSKKRNPFNHPAVMFRKQAVEAAGGYDERFNLFEDYYLWVRILRQGNRVSNLKETLVYMRTPIDMYERRGGVSYAKNLLAFNYWLLQIKWIGTFDYISGTLPHALVCILPNRLRKFVYTFLHS
ncbi:glycosyltransferase [Streptococcus caprae]|uniref:Glycosyltransferase n=1 Tax=Streptococcus caprae TaxID=1640501 RepID=A0ABV8CTR5_9STRE